MSRRLIVQLPRYFLNAALVIVLIGNLALAPALGAEPNDRPPRFAILFSGWITGTFGPCGCKVDPNGGFPRRATFSRDYAGEFEAPVIQVDAGSLFAPPGPDAQAINQALLQGAELLPIEVMNLGSEDLHLWSELAARKESKPRIISTNLIPRKESQVRPAKYAILTLEAAKTGLEKDLRIGFLGIMDPSRVKPNSGFRGQDPIAAVAEAMSELGPQVDFVVLLADYFRRGPAEPGSMLHQLATENDQIYAILTTEREYRLHTPEQVNNAIILSAIERGRQLGRLVFELDASGAVAAYTPDVVNLDESYANDPELGKLLRQLPPPPPE